MALPGFTCHARPEAAPPLLYESARSPLQTASEVLGSPGPQDA